MTSNPYALLVVIVLTLSCRVCIAAENPRFVAVAGYRNNPELRETVGARVSAILNAQKIEYEAVGLRGMTVSVPAHRATEALRLLAKVIKAEKLQLTLFIPKGDSYVAATPDSILEPKKNK